jgi:hypothetical protein
LSSTATFDVDSTVDLDVDLRSFSVRIAPHRDDAGSHVDAAGHPRG